jgi:hypothetical protein
VLLLDIEGVYGEGKSEDPISEAERIIGKLQWFLQIFVGYTVYVERGLLWMV